MNLVNTPTIEFRLDIVSIWKLMEKLTPAEMVVIFSKNELKQIINLMIPYENIPATLIGSVRTAFLKL